MPYTEQTKKLTNEIGPLEKEFVEIGPREKEFVEHAVN